MGSRTSGHGFDAPQGLRVWRANPCRRTTWRRWCVLIGAMPLLGPQRLWANTDKWTGTVSNWSSNTGWSLNHQPGNLDTAQIVGSSSGSNILTFDSVATATNLAVLWIDASKLTTSITLSQATGSLTTGLEIIGYTNSGTLSFSGGTHIVGGSGTNSLYLGYNPASTGNVNITAGSLQILNAPLYVGYNGNGNLTQSGGTVLLSGSGTNGLIVGDNNAGTYTLSGGLLSVSNGATTLGLNLELSNTFNQTGGSNITGTLDIGFFSTSSYSLSNGASLSVISTTTVGDNATGSFTQFGGNASFNSDLQIGDNASSSGTLLQSGGAASVTGNLLLGLQIGVMVSFENQNLGNSLDGSD